MKHHSTARRTAVPPPGRRRTGVRRPARARFGGAVLAAVAITVLVSGCGIRDTALPVDAGEGASRTACPPSSGASLSQLARDEFPTTGAAPQSPLPITALPTAVPSAQPTVGPTPSAKPAQTSSSPQATDSDGSLSCLDVSPSDSNPPTGSSTGGGSP